MVTREKHRLFVRDGRLFKVDGQPFDTATATTLHSGQGRAIYVMDEHGNLYASTHQDPGRLHHSSFLAGGPVAGAGEISVDDGVVTLVSRKSGHYKPEERFMQQVLTALQEQGVDTSDLVIDGGF